MFGGLQEQSRLKIMNGLRMFIEVGNHEPLKIGDLEKNTREDLPDPAVWEGVGEMTLREEGVVRFFINATKVEADRWGRGLARSLPSHRQGRRGSGMGELVLQVRGDEPGSQRSSPKWK